MLLEIEADNYRNHKRRIVYLDVPKKILIATALSNRKWSVQSQSKNVIYTINQITENCNCQLGQQKISFADLCEHIYSSNCDHKTKICKHICKVHSTLKIKIKQCKTDLKTNEKD